MVGSAIPDEVAELERAIVEWSMDRPYWERLALRALAREELIDAPLLNQFADVAAAEAGGLTPDGATLTISDFGTGSSERNTVVLLGVREPLAVNALAWEEGVEFNPEGITLIYGENGSGKSGYARVIKTITRSRHSTEVLGDVFRPPSPQSAYVHFRIGDQDLNIHWPNDTNDHLRRVSFYDSACAARYLSMDTEVAYRPSAIALLDQLVNVSGQVRSVLEGRRASSAKDPIRLPQVPLGTRAETFLQSLSVDTTELDIDVAVALPADVDERVLSLKERIASLGSADIGVTRTRLELVLKSVTTLRGLIQDEAERLNDERVSELRAALNRETVTRIAAEQASSLRFSAEPLGGVGSSPWMLLWNAARSFSEAEAYRGMAFPVLPDIEEQARCVLCQQAISEEAAARLARFDQFISDDTQRLAADASQNVARLLSTVQSAQTPSTAVALNLQRIEFEDVVAYEELRSAVENLESRRTAIVGSSKHGDVKIESLGSFPLSATEAFERGVTRQLEDLAVADPSAQLLALRSQESEIVSRQILEGSRAAVGERISQLKEMHVLDQAIRLTDTRGITRRAADLTRSHVSDVMKHRFSQETLLLDLRRVRLADAGGGQGNLRHRPQLVDAVQRVALDAVLSEGEQTALGLAGFLTEVEGDTSKSAVVFDDPVTSLDHVRRERVARRIVELSTTRQVIVFTHDVAFMVDLKRAAESADVEVSERWIARHPRGPGKVSDGGPWDAKTVGQRLDDMIRRLADVRLVLNDGDPDAQHAAVRSWYQDLRLVWERTLEEVVIGPVLVRGRLELRPTNVKVLVRITEQDDAELQAGFTRCGDRGSHDRSSEFNRPVPSVVELEQDLDALRVWHRRVKGYANG